MNEFRSPKSLQFAPLTTPTISGRSHGDADALLPIQMQMTSTTGLKESGGLKRRAPNALSVVVMGSGYVGLVTAACLAELGHHVRCVDVDPLRIAGLECGQIPIFEPGLDRFIRRGTATGHLSFEAAERASPFDHDVVLIAVGTPSAADGSADLSQIIAAATAILLPPDRFVCVVVKSTVPVGTGDLVESIIASNNPGANFAVVSNPEFLREGQAIEDFNRPDRIVVGTDHPEARAVLLSLYSGLDNIAERIVFTDRRTAELTKYAANAFLAMKLSFINEIADLCDVAGASVLDLATGIGMDTRIGRQFLRPGPGYGGSCFPKDTLALAETARRLGSPLRLIEATIDVNERRIAGMSRRIAETCGGHLEGKTVALLGLAFKANTDDLRDAPALTIARELIRLGARVRAYDPEAAELAARLVSGLETQTSAYVAAEGADVLVVMTEWDEFGALDLQRIGTLMRQKVIVDLRNIFQRGDVEALGYRYDGVGMPASRRRLEAAFELRKVGAGQ